MSPISNTNPRHTTPYEDPQDQHHWLTCACMHACSLSNLRMSARRCSWCRAAVNLMLLSIGLLLLLALLAPLALPANTGAANTGACGWLAALCGTKRIALACWALSQGQRSALVACNVALAQRLPPHKSVQSTFKL